MIPFCDLLSRCGELSEALISGLSTSERFRFAFGGCVPLSEFEGEAMPESQGVDGVEEGSGSGSRFRVRMIGSRVLLPCIYSYILSTIPLIIKLLSIHD